MKVFRWAARKDPQTLLHLLRRAPEQANRIMLAAANDEAHALLAKAIRITPIEYGPLRASGHVQTPVRTPRGVYVDIVFGGPAAPYAFWVHERLDLRHDSPTQAKFLQRPVQAGMRDYATNLAARAGAIFDESQQGGT